MYGKLLPVIHVILGLLLNPFESLVYCPHFQHHKERTQQQNSFHGIGVRINGVTLKSPYMVPGTGYLLNKPYHY